MTQITLIKCVTDTSLVQSVTSCSDFQGQFTRPELHTMQLEQTPDYELMQSLFIYTFSCVS